MCLLSTHYKPTQKSFVLSWATSPAAAQAARMAAIIAAEYPSLWPEAVRALVVHSAEWTPQMRTHLHGASGKRARARLVRRYGFGVPHVERAHEDEEKPATGGDSAEWYLGEQARNRGSIHSDILQGFAADLADRGVIGIYPVSGWWKDQPKRDRSEKGARYARVLSIETPGVETDIWTPVAQEVGVPLVVET